MIKLAICLFFVFQYVSAGEVFLPPCPSGRGSGTDMHIYVTDNEGPPPYHADAAKVYNISATGIMAHDVVAGTFEISFKPVAFCGVSIPCPDHIPDLVTWAGVFGPCLAGQLCQGWTLVTTQLIWNGFRGVGIGKITNPLGPLLQPEIVSCVQIEISVGDCPIPL